MILLLLLGAVFVTGVVVGAFALIVLGIRTENPDSIIDGEPRGIGAAARRIVNVQFIRPPQAPSSRDDERR